MKIEELSPQPTEKLHFRLSAFKSVPRETGCYVLTTYDNDVLYIGLSDNLYSRFQQHLDNPEKTNPTAAGKAFWFYFMKYDPTNLPRLERTWINQYVALHGKLPLLNKVNSPVS